LTELSPCFQVQFFISILLPEAVYIAEPSLQDTTASMVLNKSVLCY